jgi:hypothetical protein
MGEWQRLLYDQDCGLGQGQQGGGGIATPGASAPEAHAPCAPKHPLLQAVGSGGSGTSSASAATLADAGWSPSVAGGQVDAAQHPAAGQDWHHQQDLSWMQQQLPAAGAVPGLPMCAVEVAPPQPEHHQDAAAEAFDFEGLEWVEADEDHHAAIAVDAAADHGAPSTSAAGLVGMAAISSSSLDMLASLAFPQAARAAADGPSADPARRPSRGAKASDAVLAAGARSMAEQLVQLARSRPDLLLGIMGGIIDQRGVPVQGASPDYAPAPELQQCQQHEAMGAAGSPGVQQHQVHHHQQQYMAGHEAAAAAGLPLMEEDPQGSGMSGGMMGPGHQAMSPMTHQVPPYAVIQQLPARSGRRGPPNAKRRRLAAQNSAAAAAAAGSSQQPQEAPMQVMSALLQLMATAVQAQKEQQQQPQQQQQLAVDPAGAPAPVQGAYPAHYGCDPHGSSGYQGL